VKCQREQRHAERVPFAAAIFQKVDPPRFSKNRVKAASYCLASTRLDLIITGMLVSSLHATDRFTLGGLLELDLPKKQIGH
jgi:hypothetical protein